MRTCVGCRSPQNAGTLVRVARTHDGSLIVSRNAPGRGAWLCRGPASGLPLASCMESAVRRNAFSRAFRGAVVAEAVGSLRARLPERANMEAVGTTGIEDFQKGLTQ